MLTHDGHYIQKEGLAMPAPHLAHSWMTQLDATIKGEAKNILRLMAVPKAGCERLPETPLIIIIF